MITYVDCAWAALSVVFESKLKLKPVFYNCVQVVTD